MRTVGLLSCLAVAVACAQSIADSVQVPGAWVASLAYNSREDVMYGASEAGWFFAISCKDDCLISVLPLYGAFSVCYDSLDNKAFCTYHDWNWNDSLLVVDGSTHRRIKAVPIPGATDALWDPVSDRVYVSCQNSSQVAVVDARDDSLLTYIPVGFCPIKLYINSLRHKLYVLNSDEGTVSIVDMTTNQVINTVEVGGIPNAGYYCRSLDRFYCGAGNGDGDVVVIDGISDSVVATIRVAQYSDVLAVAGNDARGVVLASVYGDVSGIYTIDTGTNTVESVCYLSGESWDIHLSKASDRFYCVSDRKGEVVVLSGDGRQHLMTLHVADYPSVIGESPLQRRLYVGHSNSSKIYVIRDATTAWPEGQHGVPDTASGLRLDPSPFRDRLSIVSGTEIASGSVCVYSEDGRLVRSLSAVKTAGHVRRLKWDGRDGRGRVVPPGVFIVTAPRGLRSKVVKLR